MFVSYMIACICKFLVMSSSSFFPISFSQFFFYLAKSKLKKRNIKKYFFIIFLLSDERCASGSMMTACNTSLHLVKFDRKFVRTFDLWGSWKWNKKRDFCSILVLWLRHSDAVWGMGFIKFMDSMALLELICFRMCRNVHEKKKQQTSKKKNKIKHLQDGEKWCKTTAKIQIPMRSFRMKWKKEGIKINSLNACISLCVS